MTTRQFPRYATSTNLSASTSPSLPPSLPLTCWQRAAPPVTSAWPTLPGWTPPAPRLPARGRSEWTRSCCVYGAQAGATGAAAGRAGRGAGPPGPSQSLREGRGDWEGRNSNPTQADYKIQLESDKTIQHKTLNKQKKKYEYFEKSQLIIHIWTKSLT